MNYGTVWFFGYLRTACLTAKEFVYLASVWHVLVLLEDYLIGQTRSGEAQVICQCQAYIMAATMVVLSI
ncbi:hypothetical protein [Acetobacter persici]|uniref:hypothetical protein n=1 Tax=Acetobacter persici TaxID=1076596 RepID=UPI001F1BCCFF|nr:hypothetical protein [Acetobacter persici]MCG0998658.1 hypothetical protein [Acetobacter persici]